MTAPNFCMLLRKHLGNGRIISVTQPGLERIIDFEIEHLNEMGDICTKHLIAEFMGKHSNIIFCDNNNIIIDSIKRVSSQMSSIREVLPGRNYFIPNTEEKINPLNASINDFENTVFKKAAPISKAIYTSFTGISPVVAEEICFEASISSDFLANSLNENEKLEAKDNPSDRATVSGEYKLANPTISYLVDGKTEVVDADQPFTVTIGDGKEHTIGIQVDHPLLKENQGTDEDYVYFEYYWFDEVSLGDGKNTLNGPRSTEEQKRFSAATSNVKIQYVDGKHNTIPIAKTEHARYEGSSYEGYNDYYLVVVFGYHVVNGKKADTPFYLSANNGIGVGNANATDGAHLLQVKVDEVRIITATAGEHGAIDPEGAVTVPKGESKTFTITPDSGYYIKDVLVDGKSVGAVSTYTFKEVVADHTIHAAFAKNHTPGHPTQPEQPKVEIPDEDALGLNTDDHFAYIIGYPDGTVQPNGQITRAEATTIFFRLLTEESRSANLTKTNGYTDVASDAWYNTAVSTMTKAGIVDGYPDGTFRPDAPITRAEMAKIISLFAKLDKSESRFSDIAGHWAEAYIRLAAGNGWIAGYPDGTFGPQRNITRAETATMINRVLDRVPSEESHLLSRGVMQIWPDANPGDWFYLAMQEATNSHDYERNAKWAAADEQWTALRETRDWKAPEQ